MRAHAGGLKQLDGLRCGHSEKLTCTSTTKVMAMVL
jgi:hypothetical protein